MRDDLPSPCTGVCRLDVAGETCVGCWRTLDEIAGWARFSAEEKRQVLDALRARADRAELRLTDQT
ncbi:DUF1289 domain-containing protein [Novosphingobium sp. 9U]|uniref:DUF1289 domain-containing protein n=1 Tax=Novosphingobium sp. 9U TaxID=2653158 RepID=UPI00135A9742|nr:DUF1289 domain-containing protein [Novosphingobium sp. 9U]